MAGRFDIALAQVKKKAAPKKIPLRLKGSLDEESLERLRSCIPETVEIQSRMPPWGKESRITITVIEVGKSRSGRSTVASKAKVRTTFDHDGSVLIRLPKKYANVGQKSLQRIHLVLE